MSTANQTGTSVGADPAACDGREASSTTAPGPTEAERREIREMVSRAAEAIPLTWPIRTFISRNPLMGFEHLPFDDAVAQAKALFGGEGYLSAAEYRALHAQGRIPARGLLAALRSVDPELASLGHVCLDGREVHPEDVLRHHLVHGIDALDPRLLSWHLTTEDATRRISSLVPEPVRQRLKNRAADWARLARDPEGQYIRSLWSAALQALQIPEDAPGVQTGVGSHAEPRPSRQGLRTQAETVDGLTGSHLVGDINDQMVKWCAAFADEGMADWSMPSRGGGFYRAWRDLAPRDASVRSLGLSDWARALGVLPERPEDALAGTLIRLRIPEEQRVEYLRRHLAQLPGWAGYIRWRGANPDYPEQGRHAIDLVEYLAVRLFYEAELLEKARASAGGLEPQEPDHGGHAGGARTEMICRDAWRLFHLAQLMELAPEDLRGLSPADARTVLAWLDRLPPDALRRVWHEAYEGQYRDSLIAKLAARARPPTGEPQTHPRPRAQAAFCIDVRSESFRRHVEAQGDYETIGFAGFFAVPICYRALDSTEDLLLCPVLIKPKYVVREAVRPGQDGRVLRHALGERWHRAGHHLFHDLKASPWASYVTMDLFGFLFGLALVGKTVVLEPYHRLRDWLRRRLVPSAPTRIAVERPTEPERDAIVAASERSRIVEAFDDRFAGRVPPQALTQDLIQELRLAALGSPPEGGTARGGGPRRETNASEALGLSVEEEQALLQALRTDYGITPASRRVQLERLAARGFTEEEQVQVVENALRLMSLTKDFARLVLFCGHGSTTENNPYASAYDCGACGGNHGGPNARVLASLANHPHVRAELRQRGIEIPEDTRFLAGQHDTTTDRVTLLDLEDLPETHRPDLLQLQRDLAAAGTRNARERCTRLPGAPRGAATETAARHVRRRSHDWAQVRPEWGLSGNAAFIIGRRRLTRDLVLDGRTFLHNYDAAMDQTGKVLETIMTAPLVVAEWINFQYFFSSVDPWTYGSGSKVLHNVVSGVGVMLGRHGDLQTGLPLQSVHDGARRYHEPLRLLAVIEAGTGRLSDIVSRHEILQKLFDNRWVHLVACDPARGTFSRYQPGGQWHSLSDGRGGDL